MPVKFSKGTPDWNNPRVSAPYMGNDRIADNPRGKIMPSSTVILKINPLPNEMTIYNFPCGETNCPKLGEMELEIRTLESEFKMAICTKHAKELSYDLHKNIAINIE